MLSVLALCAIDLGFDPRSGQAKDENRYLLYIRYEGSMNKQEQRLGGLESD